MASDNESMKKSKSSGSMRSFVEVKENTAAPTANETVPVPVASSMPRGSSSDILNFYSLYGRAGATTMEAMEAFVYMKIPPDGGYAWVILVIAFLNQLIVDGMLLTIGRILPNITKSLHMSDGASAFIVSIQVGLYYASGPIASALVNKIGFRSVSIYGCVAAIIGTFIASFAEDIISLVLFFGVLVGSGYGMVYLAAQMIVGFYFEKYRAIAIGISCAGSGCGVLIFSPLNFYIVQHIGWRHTLRVHGLFSFVVLLLSVFYRPVAPTRIGKYVEQGVPGEEESLISVDSVEIVSSRYSKFLTPSEILMANDASSSQNTYQQSGQQSQHQSQHQPPQVAPQVSRFAKNMYVYSPELDFVDRCLLRFCGCCKRKVVTETPVIDEKKSIQSRSRTGTAATGGTATTDTSRKFIISVDPLDREDIFYTGNPKYHETTNTFDADNITVLPGKEKEAVAINYTMSVIKNTMPEIKTKKEHNLCHINPKFLATLNLLFDVKLFNIIEFQCLLASATLFLLGTNIPFIYITDHALIDAEHANYLLSVIGLTNIILRIFSGILAFSLNVNTLYLCGIPMLLSGILTFISGQFGRESVAFQYIYCVVFGTGTAFFSSLRALIYVDLLGLDKLTNAFGLTALSMGVSSCLGTNIAGQLTDYTGSTNIAFMFAGIVIFLSGLVKILLPTILKFKRPLVVPTEEQSSRKVKFLLGKSKSTIS